MEYPFSSCESWKIFIDHPDIKKDTKTLFRNCFLCEETMTKKKKTTNIYLVRKHFNECLAVADLFEKIKEQDKTLLESHSSFKPGSSNKLIKQMTRKDLPTRNSRHSQQLQQSRTTQRLHKRRGIAKREPGSNS